MFVLYSLQKEKREPERQSRERENTRTTVTQNIKKIFSKKDPSKHKQNIVKFKLKTYLKQ
jgi:hypothetical protein